MVEVTYQFSSSYILVAAPRAVLARPAMKRTVAMARILKVDKVCSYLIGWFGKELWMCFVYVSALKLLLFLLMLF